MVQWTNGDQGLAEKFNQICETGSDNAKGTPEYIGQAYFATDTKKLYMTSNGSTWDLDLLVDTTYVLFARPHTIIAADGITVKQIDHVAYSYQNVAEDGDRLQAEFLARGTELYISIGLSKMAWGGKFDLYVNGVLDTSGTDTYAASPADYIRFITLTEPILPGYNIIELRVNGKNAASGGYIINTYGISLQ